MYLHSRVVLLGPSHSCKAPPIGPSGLLGPQGPHELPTKVYNAIQTIGWGTKSTFTQVGLSLKAKRHCLEDFQTPPSEKREKKKKEEPRSPLHTLPLNSLDLKKVHNPSDGDVGAKYTAPSSIPPAGPQTPPISPNPLFSGQKPFRGRVYVRVLVDTIVA